MSVQRTAAAWLFLAGGLLQLAGCSHEQSAAEANSPELEALLARCRAGVAAMSGVAFPQAELALAYEANGRWVEAAQAYAEACKLEPDEPQWVTHAAICEAEAGELERAQRTLEAAAAQFPECALILQRLAVAQLEDGDFARARVTFDALAKLESHAVEGWTGLAEVELARGAPDEALAAAERALGIDPEYRLPRYLRAVCLRELGRAAEAAREFEQAGIARRRMIGDAWSARAAEFAVGFEARFARAVGLLDGGQVPEARAIFEVLARERPADLRTIGNLAMAQAAAKDFSAALASCDAALAREPKSAVMHAARARVLLGAQRPLDALVAARRASELDPRNASHFELLGFAQAANGETQACMAAWKEALRLDPSNAALRRRMETLETR